MEVLRCRCLNERPYGLVISDLNMFPMSGFELLRSVRGDGRLRETLFVMMTTKSTQMPSRPCAGRGERLLVKPFMPGYCGRRLKRSGPQATALLTADLEQRPRCCSCVSGQRCLRSAPVSNLVDRPFFGWCGPRTIDDAD